MATHFNGATLRARGVPSRLGQELPGSPIEPTPRIGPSVVSFGQQRLWFVAQLFPDTPLYNEPILVKMEGPVDAAVLAQCLTEITRRHEAWRTVFTTVEGRPMQKVRPPQPFDLPVIDLTSLPAPMREPEAARLSLESARLSFDLAEGPLVRALLLRLTEEDTRLLVTAHHIVVDGVSFFNVFLPELHALYVAFSQGRPSPLPEVPVQFADFAAWQRRWLTEEVLAPKLAYSRARLSGLTELSLPTDHPRPSEPVGHGARAPVALPSELTAKLRDIGRRVGMTLFTTLLAAWKTLLFRYSGQGDVVVGSASAGRPRPELDRLIGFFNHNLVLRTQLDGSMTFIELLPRVGEVLKGARENEDVPFDRLITELSVDRSVHKNPLYNNVLILMPPLGEPSEPPRWSASRIDIGTAKVDLYLELHQRPSGLIGHIEYQTELFSEATIARMIGHFTTLLEGIAQDPEQRLSELPLLTAAEQRELAVFQGPVTAPRPDSEVASLEQLFEAQAARSGAAIAVEHGDERLTYEELNARANRLARSLRAAGVGPDTVVGLCVTRSFNSMIGILGTLKAGGAYLPLDPEYPAPRLRFLIEDAGVELVLTDRKSAHKVPDHSGLTVLLDEGWDAVMKPSDANLSPVAAAGDLAYVLYTSGSSGSPKGVLVERRGLYHLARAQERMFGLGEGSRVLQFFSLNFDVSVWELLMTWSVGATLVLADPMDLLPGQGLARLLRDKDIHVVAMTPSALAVTPFQELPALHTIITAGEALPEELVKRWAPGRRFFNGYGPTETTVVSVIAECRAGEGKPPIGRPFDFVEVQILDSAMRPVPIGVPGELYIGGPGVARGYLNRPELTVARFIENPLPERAGERLYRTGDRVKWRPDGSIDYLGRTDRQIKLRGFRIELGEIEAELVRHPAVQTATIEVLDVEGDKRLVAYIVPGAGAPEGLDRALKKHLRDRLPEHMVPATFVTLNSMPVNPSGKIDRARLPAPLSPGRSAAPSSSALERDVTAIWREILGVHDMDTDIDADASFFEVGGHSLALARVQAALSSRLWADVDIMTLMRLPTIRQLAAHLATLPGIERALAATERAEPAAQTEAPAPSPDRSNALAIVGMAIRAPGIRSPEDLWDVVRAGRETIRALDPEALIAAGADPARVRGPGFVAAEGVLEDADRFDAAFFGYSDADASLMDPQQRLFLECAYEALEHAGCDPARFEGRIGVLGGSGAPLHWLGPVADSLRASSSDQQKLRARTLNAPDFLTMRVAYKLGLRGPAVTVQTACSTSLAAVHMARESLLAGDCDIALAGGVTLSTLSEAEQGYTHDKEGGYESADGHCRPFDAGASGMVKSSGVAIVVMKRLSDALANGDTIHAVVIGSAMNNDGAGKMGFTTPSEEGIAGVVQRAFDAAGVVPGSVQFVEAHGTGTRLGDPVEVRALTRAYRRWTERCGYCALGSLKANVGHMDSAAGAAGLIKAVLGLANEAIPPVAGFRAPNPILDLPSTPFVVSNALVPWPRSSSPRRAGVNAIGVGGTNVHVLLEEAPPIEAPAERRPFQLLCLSARTPTALAEVSRRLGDHLARHPSIDIADVAHTLATGRPQQRCRAVRVCQGASEAVDALAPASRTAPSAASALVKDRRPVVLLFPGYGGQYLKMGLDVYEAEPLFRAEVERCFTIVLEDAGLDLRSLWLDQMQGGELRLDEAQWVQPLLFTIEYALAQQLIAWGVRPAAMLGHSLGEYVAACVADVFSLRDALALVIARGHLADTTPPGGMLAVFADQRTIDPYLGDGVTVATYAPGSVVLTGLSEDIEAARARIEGAGLQARRLRAPRAGHSPVMRAVRDAFRKRVAEVELRPPTIPIVSNMTGKYMTAAQATSPDSWADHLCSAVRLEDGLGTLLDIESPICLELGAGTTLGSALKGHPRYGSNKVDVVETLPDFRRRAEPSYAALLRGLGRAWELGMEVDFRTFYAHENRRRIPLPSYPFEGRRYTLGAAPAGDRAARSATDAHDRDSARVGAERIAKGIWTRLLGVSDVPPGASFFDMGGDSLLAVQLLSELRAKTGCEIKLRQFVAQPTMAGVAALLRLRVHLPALAAGLPAPEQASQALIKAAGPERAPSASASASASCLVALRKAGRKRPFFCVHPIGGGALCYAPLVAALDPERPFYGLQSPMVEDRSARPGSIEEMAALYVAAIRQIQPQGPYLLGGWSFGGVVATEMARQLAATEKKRGTKGGQAVAGLVLLDVSDEPPRALERLRLIDERLPVLAALPSIFAGTRSNGRQPALGVERLADILGAASQHLVIHEHHLALWRRHKRADLDVPTTHFIAQSRSLLGSLLRVKKSPKLGVRAPTTVLVPGDHFSMILGESAPALAERLGSALDAADAREIAPIEGAEVGSAERDDASVRDFVQRYVDQTLELDSASLVEEMWVSGDACALVAVDGRIIAGSGPIQSRLARGFAPLRAARIRLREERVLLLAGGRAACFTALLDSDLTLAKDGRRVSYRSGRVSWVLEKHGDAWRAVHAHYSLPMGMPENTNE